MKYTNTLLFIALITLGFFLKDSMQLSTNLLALFAPKESVKNLNIANELGYSKEMLVALKYRQKRSKSEIQELKKLVKELEALEGVERVTYKVTPSKELKSYFKTHFALLAAFDERAQTEVVVKRKLEKIYNKQLTNIFYTPVDKNDPLALFTMQTQESVAHRGKYMSLGEYGYLLRVRTAVNPSDVTSAKTLYEATQNVLKKHPEAVAFAPFFYMVENSQKIKGDVEIIVALSTLLLLLIYFVMLREIKLLLSVVMTLGSSMIFAALICMHYIENFSVLSLAFGASLSAVSIDYLLHYYFHDFYNSGKKFDKSVFYGFFTTIAAFGIFSFIPVALISQISTFALLSLSFSYLVFTFLYNSLEIKHREIPVVKKEDGFKLSSLLFTLLSFVLLAFALSKVEFDNNIKNLDYQNIKLQTLQTLFLEANTNKLSPVILQAQTQERLLERLHTLKNQQKHSLSLASFVPSLKECQARKELLASYDFKRLRELVNAEASLLGFKEGYFSSAYKFTQNTPSCSELDVSLFASLNLSIYKDKEALYTIAMVGDVPLATSQAGVAAIDVKSMFAKVAEQMFSDISRFGLYVLVTTLFLLLLSVKERFFYALNYILFPLSLTLAVLSAFYSLNIMHLFALIILTAIGIDYGIYMSKSKHKANTALAIRYSLYSTFAAFGVLIFSSITALNSIGIVITLGSGAIFLLIRFMR